MTIGNRFVEVGRCSRFSQPVLGQTIMTKCDASTAFFFFLIRNTGLEPVDFSGEEHDDCQEDEQTNGANEQGVALVGQDNVKVAVEGNLGDADGAASGAGFEHGDGISRNQNHNCCSGNQVSKLKADMF